MALRADMVAWIGWTGECLIERLSWNGWSDVPSGVFRVTFPQLEIQFDREC